MILGSSENVLNIFIFNIEMKKSTLTITFASVLFTANNNSMLSTPLSCSLIV